MGVIGEPTGPGRWVFSLQKWDHLGPLPWSHLGVSVASGGILLLLLGNQVSLKISRISHHKIKDKKHLHNFNLKKNLFKTISFWQGSLYIYTYIYSLFFLLLTCIPLNSPLHHHLLKRCMIESFENTISSRLETLGSRARAPWVGAPVPFWGNYSIWPPVSP